MFERVCMQRMRVSTAANMQGFHVPTLKEASSWLGGPCIRDTASFTRGSTGGPTKSTSGCAASSSLASASSAISCSTWGLYDGLQRVDSMSANLPKAGAQIGDVLDCSTNRLREAAQRTPAPGSPPSAPPALLVQDLLRRRLGRHGWLG